MSHLDHPQEKQTGDQQSGDAPVAASRHLGAWGWARDGRSRRRLWKRTKLAWKAFSGFITSFAAVAASVIGLLAAAYFVGLLYERFTQRAIEIIPIAVTDDLNKRGYTSTVVADRLRDAVNELIAKAPSVESSKAKAIELKELKRKRNEDIVIAPIVGLSEEIELKGEQADIIVPSVGLSVDTIVVSISSRFGRDNIQDVSGEIVQRDKRLSLTLRVNEVGVIGVYTAGFEHPDALFASAAPTILAKTEPYFYGVILAGKGKSAEAITEYREAIRRNLNAAAAYGGIGAILNEKGKLAYAEAQFRKAIQLDRNAVAAYIDLGAILDEERNLPDAEAQFRAAIGIDPNSPLPHRGLGHIFDEERNLPAAEREFRETIQLDPSLMTPHYDLGYVLFEEGKLAESKTQFRKAIQLDPKAEAAYNDLGAILFQEGRLPDAEEQYRKVIGINPNNTVSHYNLGLVFVAARKYSDAEAQFREAVRIEPQSAAPRNSLGDVLNVEGQHDKAEAQLRKAIQLDPHLAAAYSNLGLVFVAAHWITGNVTHEFLLPHE